MVILAILVFAGCQKDQQGAGSLDIKCFNPMATSTKSTPTQLKSTLANPALEGEITETVMTSLKLGIVEMWASQDEVKAGEPDNLKWVKLMVNPDAGLKLFEEITIPESELPAGEYKSLKIVFRNNFFRYCRAASDPAKIYEILETMGSYSDPCDPNDLSLARPSFFSTGGSFSLDDDKFKLSSEGEKVAGFTIEEGKKSTLTWRLGAGTEAVCINYLVDRNANLQWDCGTDKVEIECPPEVKYMWDFVVN